MKLHKTTTRNTPEANPIGSTAGKSTDAATESHHPKVQLKAVYAHGHIESEPPHDAIVIQPSTMLRAKQKGLDEHFVHLIKKITLWAIEGLERGGIVTSPMLCSEIRYGLRKDTLVDVGNVPGLDKGERLEAGKAIWLLADAGELSLEPLGPNKANLQQYRVK